MIWAPPGVDPKGVWAAVLRQAVVDSWVAGYHSWPVPWVKGARNALKPIAPAAAAAPGGSRASGSAGGAGTEPEQDGGGKWQHVPARVYAKPAVTAARKRVMDSAQRQRLEAALRALGRPFVDWEARPPVIAREGEGAW
jgi:hypothetical protein